MAQRAIYSHSLKPLCRETACVFVSGTSSHEQWRNFIGKLKDLNIDDIATMIDTQYDAQFFVTPGCWWFQFPDVASKMLFEITWL